MNAQAQPAFPGKLALFTVVGLAAVIVAVAVAKESDSIDGALAKRVAGITIGAVLVVSGNALPKLVRPIDTLRGGVMGAERFAGRTFVLAGLAYIAAWLLLPLNDAMLFASLVGVSVFFLVAAAWLWLTRGQRLDESLATALEGHDSPTHGQATMTRGALLLVLHAVFWVLAMFVADAIWGDRVAQWMAIAFGIVNGLLSAPLALLVVRSRSTE